MKKTFRAVEYMRRTRDRLSKRYQNSPIDEDRDLARIREKYKGFKRPADHSSRKADVK